MFTCVLNENLQFNLIDVNSLLRVYTVQTRSVPMLCAQANKSSRRILNATCSNNNRHNLSDFNIFFRVYSVQTRRLMSQVRSRVQTQQGMNSTSTEMETWGTLIIGKWWGRDTSGWGKGYIRPVYIKC